MRVKADLYSIDNWIPETNSCGPDIYIGTRIFDSMEELDAENASYSIDDDLMWKAIIILP